MVWLGRRPGKKATFCSGGNQGRLSHGQAMPRQQLQGQAENGRFYQKTSTTAEQVNALLAARERKMRHRQQTAAAYQTAKRQHGPPIAAPGTTTGLPRFALRYGRLVSLAATRNQHVRRRRMPDQTDPGRGKINSATTMGYPKSPAQTRPPPSEIMLKKSRAKAEEISSVFVNSHQRIEGKEMAKSCKTNTATTRSTGMCCDQLQE